VPMSIEYSFFIKKILVFVVVLPLLLPVLAACDIESGSDSGQRDNREEKLEDSASAMPTETPPEPGQKAEPVDALLAGLISRLEAQPEDVDGWVLLARSYQYLGRPDEAKMAFRKAADLGYSTPDNNPHSQGDLSRSSSFAGEPIYQVMEEVLDDQPATEKNWGASQ